MNSAVLFFHRFSGKFPMGEETVVENKDALIPFSWIFDHFPDPKKWAERAPRAQASRVRVARTIFLGQDWTMRYRDERGRVTTKHGAIPATPRTVKGVRYDLVEIGQPWKSRAEVFVRTEGNADAKRCREIWIDQNAATGKQLDLEVHVRPDAWFWHRVVGNPFSEEKPPTAEYLMANPTVVCNAAKEWQLNRR